MARHQVSDRDRTYLRYAIELSRRSRDAGKHPFGALVVDARGSITAQQRTVRALIAPFVQTGRGDAAAGEITNDESV